MNKGKTSFAPHTRCELRDAVLARQGYILEGVFSLSCLLPSRQRSRAHLINSSHTYQYTPSKHSDQNKLPPCSHRLKSSGPELCVCVWRPFTHYRRYEFFQPMMVRVVENKLRTAGDMKSKLCCVSVKEGSRVGAGLALAMATNLTAEAGVDEWIGNYRCLGELDREEAWFRPMLNVVGKRSLGEVSWGLKMRVFMGAGLSIMDMSTDIFVILRFMEKEETRGYGWSLMLMVLGSIVMQLLLVFGQNKKKPVVMLKEFLIVLTGLKPAIDCMRC